MDFKKKNRIKIISKFAINQWNFKKKSKYELLWIFLVSLQ
jgi:hypothetical protein